MKSLLFRVLCSFYIIGCCIPMMGQDYMNIFFKNGDFRKFYMKNVTEIAVTKTDSLGIEHFDYDYQHITTLTDKYVYKLQDVDSVTFTKHNEKIGEQNYVSAMSAIFPMLSDCESIEDAEGKIDLIKSAEGVKDAWSDGHQLYVQVIDDETYFFHFNQDLERENNQHEEIANKVRQLNNRSEFVFTNGSQLSGLILNLQNEDENRQYIIEEYLDPLMKMNDNFAAQDFNKINWHYFPNPTLDYFLRGIYSYDIIFLITHGSYQPYDVGGRTIYLHSICAPGPMFTINVQSNNSEGPTKDDLQKYKQSLISYRDDYGASDLELGYGYVKELQRGKMRWVIYPCITEKFFQNLSKREFSNKNSILFNVSCQSLKGNYNFGRALLDKGLGVYFGYDETNWIGQQAGYHFFRNLFQGYSLEKAFNDLEDEEKNNHVSENKNFVAHLHALSYMDKGAVLNTFVFPTYTGFKNDETAQEEFERSEKVMIEGITTYGEQINYDLKYGFFVRVDQKVDLEDLSSAQNIEAETIQDETDSWYGNLLFKAPLTNLVGDHKYYYIAYTYDGLYYNYNYNPNVFDYAFFVEGLHCPDKNHPHMIDLGLPSGTKWCCCNVGANSPEDYGGYFAWGEIREKSSYMVSNYAYKTTVFPEGNEHVYVVTENGVNYYSLVDRRDISGSSYDVARASLGVPWRMPTQAEMRELEEYALHHSKRDSYNGVAGVTVTGPNGNKVFFPFTGSYNSSGLYDVGECADYWSSTPSTYNGWKAYIMRAADNHISVTQGYLSWGAPIRPVCK